jgi:hypothetical protein
MKSNFFSSEKAQASLEYLLMAAFSISLAISAALVVEALRSMAVEAQAEIIKAKLKVIETLS